MEYRIKYSRQALKDYGEIKIKEYITKRDEESRAHYVLGRIDDQLDILERNPTIGMRFNEKYRYILCWSYKIFYEIIGDAVIIARVIHGKRKITEGMIL